MIMRDSKSFVHPLWRLCYLALGFLLVALMAKALAGECAELHDMAIAVGSGYLTGELAHRRETLPPK
jgi:hypothetical protein